MGYWNEDDDGNLIEKQRGKLYLKWVISIKQDMITAMNINAEYFCRKVFEKKTIVPQLSRERGSTFPFQFQNNYY